MKLSIVLVLAGLEARSLQGKRLKVQGGEASERSEGRRTLAREMMPEKMGVEQDVPSTWSAWPPM